MEKLGRRSRRPGSLGRLATVFWNFRTPSARSTRGAGRTGSALDAGRPAPPAIVRRLVGSLNPPGDPGRSGNAPTTTSSATAPFPKCFGRWPTRGRYMPPSAIVSCSKTQRLAPLAGGRRRYMPRCRQPVEASWACACNHRQRRAAVECAPPRQALEGADAKTVPQLGSTRPISNISRRRPLSTALAAGCASHVLFSQIRLPERRPSCCARPPPGRDCPATAGLSSRTRAARDRGDGLRARSRAARSALVTPDGRDATAARSSRFDRAALPV